MKDKIMEYIRILRDEMDADDWFCIGAGIVIALCINMGVNKITWSTALVIWGVYAFHKYW